MLSRRFRFWLSTFWQGKMSVINTNNAALKSNLASKIANSSLTKSAQRLSSGRRINSSADDAAGTAVGLKLHAQLQGQKAAIKAEWTYYTKEKHPEYNLSIEDSQKLLLETMDKTYEMLKKNNIHFTS